MQRLRGQRGTALVEAAIVLPCLVLILLWSIALTDVALLKLKAAEAARFALWETTVWKTREQIDREVRERFDDLRSPAGIRRATTGLLSFPRASRVRWTSEIDTAAEEVELAGNRLRFAGGPAVIGPFVAAATSWISGGVQAAMRSERFDIFGAASARVHLQAGREGSRLLAGGDLLGRRGADDLGARAALGTFALASPLRDRRPLHIVFDTWKAWPKPAAFQRTRAPTDIGTPPQQTYPAVEKQVAAQLEPIAFFGLRQKPWFTALDSVTTRILGNVAAAALAGGRLPRIFSTGRMDSPEGGPVTIRPIAPPQADFVPDLCDTPAGRQERCTSGHHGAQRIGDVEADEERRLVGLDAYTEAADATRSTVPYRITSRYWRASGGTETGSRPSWSALPARVATSNQYVEAWSCRGYFFAGSTRAQEPRAQRRYRAPCN